MRPFIKFTSRNIQKSNEYYLSFNIGDDCFAANFPKVAGFSKDFEFSHNPGWVPCLIGKAKINDEIIPVIDLKAKLGIETDASVNTGKLVIIETEVLDNVIKIGIFYNLIGDAFEISSKKMMPVPNIGNQYKDGYVKGIHIQDDKCIMVLDFDKLFDIDDLIDIKLYTK